MCASNRGVTRECNNSESSGVNCVCYYVLLTTRKQQRGQKSNPETALRVRDMAFDDVDNEKKESSLVLSSRWIN